MKLTAGSFENLGFFIERLRAPDLAWLRGVGGSIVLSVAARAVGLVNAVLLARLLQPSGYGLFSYAYAIAALLSVPAQFGIPTVVTREVAAAESLGRWDIARGAIRWGHWGAVILSLAVVAVAACVLAFAAPRLTSMEFATYAAAMALVPLLALDALRGAALTGLRRVVLGNLPANLLRPVAVLLGLALAFFFFPSMLSTAVRAMILLASAAALAYLAGGMILLRVRPPELRRARPSYDTHRWGRSAIPLGMGVGLQLVNQYAGMLILGIFATKSVVGEYRVAFLGASLIVMGLVAIDVALQPYFARYFAAGDYALLQLFGTRSARLAVLAAIPILVCYIVFGKEIIIAAFGRAYAPAYGPLLVLSFGQAINAATGSVGSLLNMARCERDVMYGVMTSAALTVILCFALVPAYGIEGAAVATAAGVAGWNGFLSYRTWRRLGVIAGPIRWRAWESAG